MQRPAFSIRSILLYTLSILTLLIVLLAGRESWVSWHKLSQIQSLRSAIILSDTIFDATEKLSVERDIAITMLHAPDEKTLEDLKPRLEESRSLSDAAMRAALKALMHYEFSELAELQQETNRHLADIQILRSQIDRAVTLPAAERDTKLAEQWHEEVNGLIDQTQILWLGFVKHFTNINPIVTQHLRYKHFLRTIAKYMGQERAIIGQLIVENASPSSEELVKLLHGSGVIDLSWQTTAFLADQSGLMLSIAPYYKDAKSHYLTLQDMVQDSFYKPGVHHEGAYPITVDLWLELANQAADSLDALNEASVKETQRYVEILEQAAKQAILVHASILLFSLALAGFCFRLITRRVIQPINDMVAALMDTMHGKAVSFALPERYATSEIAKLVQVLEISQKNVDIARHASAKIAQSESRLRAVVDNTVDGLIAINEKGIIESFNPACEFIFGYRAEEVIGKNIKTLMPEPYHSEHDGYLARYIATGEARIIGTAGREVSAKRKDGSVFPIDLSISAYMLEDGRHFSGIIRDITERKEAEAQLLRYMKELERSNQELDDFAYIASHDLKEPLRGLFNHASFLLEDYSEKLDEDGVRRLNRLSHLAQRMEHLVNDLLYFSRLGRTDLAVQEIDPNAVIIDIEQMMEGFLKEKHARILIPKPLPNVVCDRPRITEVFRNLITNAIKYNDKPDRLVEVGFVDKINTPQGLERNAFYVKDNGIGIAPEFHQEIFRIFKRLQRPTEEKEAGTGVGLTFVKKIIERHKGRIWLESTPGEGTTFYFNLERKEP